MDDECKESEPLPYMFNVEPIHEDWNKKVQLWGWKEIGVDRYLTEGNCPNCHHKTSFPVSVGHLTNFRQDDEPTTVVVPCECGCPHTPFVPNQGCGMKARVAFSFGSVVSSKVTNFIELGDLSTEKQNVEE